MVAAGGLDDHVRLHRGDGLGLVAFQDLVGADGPGDFQRLGVHVHGDDPPGARAFEDGHGQGADGSAADHQGRLAR